MRKPNSQECSYYGRKLSNTICEEIQHNADYLYVGSENDDLIYFGKALPDNEEMLKERVKISVEVVDAILEIDLEDVLKFASKYCSGIYNRVYTEAKGQHEKNKNNKN